MTTNIIISGAFSNTIMLYPSPEYSMSILDVQYKNQNGEWRRVETYPVRYDGNTEIPQEIPDAGKQIFSFPKRQITELQIKVKQPYWFTNNNKRIFMYGFQDIIVEYREYSQDTAEFVTKFSIEDTNRRFTSVISPTVKDPIGCAFISDYTIDHELYFDESLTREV